MRCKYLDSNSAEEKKTGPGEELEEIIRIVLRLNNPKLKQSFSNDDSSSFNGLQNYSCETCIYTNNNMFYIQSPIYSKDNKSEFWEIGFLDIKNTLFYELNFLAPDIYERSLFFYDWSLFFEIIIEKKIYANLFKFFNFDKATLTQNDRMLYEPAFFKVFNDHFGHVFQTNFVMFLCDVMKNNNNMISYKALKRKIASNLKNFMATNMMSTFNSVNK